MTASEFIQYCKDKYVCKVVALKRPMCLCGKYGSIISRHRGHIDVIEDVHAASLRSVVFCFKEYSAIFSINCFKEVNPYDGNRTVSDLFEIVDN